jgi:hypothetical protein
MKLIILGLVYINCLRKQSVEVIPEELSFDKQIDIQSKGQIYIKEGKRDFGDDILKYNGRLYYKDPIAYYGPKVTYSKMYEQEKDNFLVCIVS